MGHKSKGTSYKEALKYLYSLQKFGIKFGLSKTANLLEAFGNPHKQRSFIHIAGTNGKGSVASFITSVLKEAGLKVGLYSSPHLVRFTERFRINGREISEKTAAGLIEEIRSVAAPDEPPTFFEAATAMAFLYFDREDTDIAVMEVGMGGRLDATNLITPLVSVITNISLEHQAFLGPRLLDIAGEKAGIIKPGVDLITGATQPHVVKLFSSMCEKMGSPFFRVGKDIRYRSSSSGFHYRGLTRRFNGLRLGLKGNFQARNAALALASVERLEAKGFTIADNHIKSGMESASWPGRIHVISNDPLIVLDGAHNPAAIRALGKAIKSGFTYRRLILVMGVMEDKDIAGLVQGIAPVSDYVICTRPVYSRAADPGLLMQQFGYLKKPGEIIRSLSNALEKARSMADPEDLILVCGSLFTVGEAMTYFDPVKNKPD